MNGFVVVNVVFFAVVGMVGLVVALFLLWAFIFALLRWVMGVVGERYGLMD